MRCVVEPGRSLRLFRLAVLASISVAAVGCSSDTHRFESDNPFGSQQPRRLRSEVTGSVPQQRRRACRARRCRRRNARARSADAAGRRSAPPAARRGMASYQPRSRPARDVTGSVAARPAGRRASPAGTGRAAPPITVQQGETIDGLVTRYGVPAVRDRRGQQSAERLGAAARPAPGHPEIRGRPAARSPRAAANAPRMRRRRAIAAPRRPRGGQHVHIVAPGETLMKLSRQYNKPLVEIARANNIAPHTLVKVGDRIVIPGVRGAAAAPRPQPMPRSRRRSQPAPQSPQPQRRPPRRRSRPRPRRARDARRPRDVVTPAAQSPEPPKAKPDVTAAMPTFRWPVRGRVIAGFGPKPTGQQNDGINVAVPEGTPIKAAEDGVVAYAGNELKSYGNLVLVRHANGYVTAYAHASEIMVKRDDTDQARPGDRQVRPDRQRDRAATALRDPQGRDAGRSDAVPRQGRRRRSGHVVIPGAYRGYRRARAEALSAAASRRAVRPDPARIATPRGRSASRAWSPIPAPRGAARRRRPES